MIDKINKEINKSAGKAKLNLEKLKNRLVKLSPSPILAFLSQERLLDYAENLTESAASVYDKALDAEYLKNHIGGANHRMFDGGHDVISAWEKVRDASPDDSLNEEVAAYFTSLWKDLNTNKGLPFMTLDKVKYERTAEWMTEHIPYANKSWVYDLFSFDSIEVFSSTLSAAAVVFTLKKEDMESLAELLGSAGVISLISANPIMGMLMILTAAYAYINKKKEFKSREFGIGVLTSTVSMAIFSVLGLSVFLEFIIVILVVKILKDHLNKEIDLKETLMVFKENFAQKAKKLNLNLK
ncbi:MAG: hypothetical protein ACOCRX_07785 [Candidatus Woesearchaeota archaeon]